MRAVVQRVLCARVEVDGHAIGAIERGLLAYVGFGRSDGDGDRAWMVSKIAGLRVFEDGAGKMSLALADVGGALLVVSQFTLYGDVRRGRRPSFDEAMAPPDARVAYDALVRDARAAGAPVETGRFGADMKVHAVIDGPVTLWLDSALAPGAPSRGG
jgi:D-aminoacyl-tRNA deacylase